VFHKDEISRGGAGLLPEVTAVLADPERQVVGVVVNAVDDWLLKGDQLRAPWTAGVISGLEAILSAARDGGRTVVLLSDHGHVIERGTEFRTVATEGERWRSIGAVAPAAAVATPPSASTTMPKLAPGQLPLFTPPVPVVAVVDVPGAASAEASPDWVRQLLASKTFKDQLQRNARLGLDADRARRFLETLAERGGRLPLDAMARQLDLPHVRLTGLVAAMRRVLNLDGYSTLSVDEASSTVVVNADLVRSLFGLEG
jgi:hypothetical protein